MVFPKLSSMKRSTGRLLSNLKAVGRGRSESDLGDVKSSLTSSSNPQHRRASMETDRTSSFLDISTMARLLREENEDGSFFCISEGDDCISNPFGTSSSRSSSSNPAAPSTSSHQHQHQSQHKHNQQPPSPPSTSPQAPAPPSIQRARQRRIALLKGGPSPGKSQSDSRIFIGRNRKHSNNGKHKEDDILHITPGEEHGKQKLILRALLEKKRKMEKRRRQEQQRLEQQQREGQASQTDGTGVGPAQPATPSSSSSPRCRSPAIQEEKSEVSVSASSPSTRTLGVKNGNMDNGGDAAFQIDNASLPSGEKLQVGQTSMVMMDPEASSTSSNALSAGTPSKTAAAEHKKERPSRRDARPRDGRRKHPAATSDSFERLNDDGWLEKSCRSSSVIVVQDGGSSVSLLKSSDEFTSDDILVDENNSAESAGTSSLVADDRPAPAEHEQLGDEEEIPLHPQEEESGSSDESASLFLSSMMNTTIDDLPHDIREDFLFLQYFLQEQARKSRKKEKRWKKKVVASRRRKAIRRRNDSTDDDQDHQESVNDNTK